MFDEGEQLLPLLAPAFRRQISLFGQGGRAILRAIRAPELRHAHRAARASRKPARRAACIARSPQRRRLHKADPSPPAAACRA